MVAGLGSYLCMCASIGEIIIMYYYYDAKKYAISTYQSLIQSDFLTNLFSTILNPSLNCILGSDTLTYFHPMGS